ncbi:response regulator transcription factor [bacterium SCSIO 12741]|nr:response regulator transcription factor [bacterium SCSIO 12741]
MKIQILIVEDNAIVAEKTKLYIQEYEHFNVKDIAYNYSEALELIHRKEYDLAIVDIHLGRGKSGIEVAQLLKDKGVHFIYLTSYADQETISSAALLEPIGYLVKPISKANLFANLEMARLNFFGKDQIEIREGKSTLYFLKSQVFYIKSSGNYCEVFDQEGAKVIRQKITDWTDQDPKTFVRVHRSYVINRNKIKAIGKEITLVSGDIIPVSAGYRDHLKDWA